MIPIAAIRAARERIAPSVKQTPLDPSTTLSAMCKVVVIVSGGNIDMNLLDRIINLGLVQEGRLARFVFRLADRPGELGRLIACVASSRANIHQIRHERAEPGLPLTQAEVVLELETRGREHVHEIERQLAAAGFTLRG